MKQFETFFSRSVHNAPMDDSVPNTPCRFFQADGKRQALVLPLVPSINHPMPLKFTLHLKMQAQEV